MIARKQQLAQIQQARAAKVADLAAAQRAISQAQAQAAGVESSRAGLAQQATQAEVARGYTLTSPIAGTVTAMTAHWGNLSRSSNP